MIWRIQDFYHPTARNESSYFVDQVSPEISSPITYAPGNLTINQNGLSLSTGLSSRVVAVSGSPVLYITGEKSKTKFHSNPDGGAVFADSKEGGWIYVSNSEKDKGRGGVGAIKFDKNGK